MYSGGVAFAGMERGASRMASMRRDVFGLDIKLRNKDSQRGSGQLE